MKNSRAIRMLILTLIISGLCAHSCYSQQMTAALDKLFESRYENEKSGASVLISKNGHIVYMRQFGLADVENNIPITGSTKFSIGSVTKQFTAGAILMLQEQGKINVNKSVGSYLPEFVVPNYTGVTIAHLLTHTSGVPSDNHAKVISKNLRNHLLPHDIVDAIKNEPLLFVPGEKYDYSNNAYVLLGLVIEKVSGLSYSEFLDRNIFKPLSMTNTQVGYYQDVIMNRANGYTGNENDELVNATYHSSSFSAGAIVSTAEDLNKWIGALFSEKIINKKSLDLMLQNYTLNNGNKLNIGFGWEINEIVGSKTFEHTGFEPGFKTNSIYAPEEELYIVVLQNNEMGSPTPSSIKAMAISLNKPYAVKRLSKQLAKDDLDNIVGTYQLSSGDKRVVGRNDNGFYYKALGGKERQLYVGDKKTLFFEKEYVQLHFENDASGKIIAATYKNRNYEAHLLKISNNVPKENVAISIPTATLKKYIGSYKSEQFIMKISLENENLYAQPEGSDKLMLQPKANNKFFIKEIGAEIEFVSDKTNVIKHINILLEGNVMKGVKVIN